MANRELKTKIKLRYDLLANWTEKNPELLAGEIAIVAIPSGVTEMQVDGSQPNPPQILFKVGPGKFNNLSYASAKAADVYGWAKAASKPTYRADEVGAYSKTELDPILARIDTNTKYQIVKDGDNGFKLQAKEINGEWADVEGSSFKVDFEAINAEIAKKLDSATFETFESGYNTTIGDINESLAKKLEVNDIADKADTTYVDNKLAEKVNLSDYNTKIGEIANSISEVAGDITDLSGLVNEDIKEITENLQNNYYTKGEIDGEVTNLETWIGNIDTAKVNVSDYNAKMELLDGSISSLNSNKVNSSDFEAYKTEADGKFLKEHQDISGKADITYVDSEIKKVDDAVKLLTDGAGTDEIDSVNELIDYVNKHGATVTGLQNDIKANADAIDVLEAKPAMGISSDDITNWNGIEGRVDEKLAKKVNLEGYVAYSQEEKDKLAGLENYDDTAVKGLISAEETRAKGVEEGLEGRISTLEGKPFGTYATKTEVEAVDTLVDGAIERIGNIEADYLKSEDKTALSNAINTEKGRIDTLVTETIPGINSTIDTLATKTEVKEVSDAVKVINETIPTLATKSEVAETYETKENVKSVSDRVKVVEDNFADWAIIWDCGGAE